ncbi:MAG: hypothetical protein R6V10_14075 [bacterium]
MKRILIVLLLVLAGLSCDKDKSDETACLVNEEIPPEKLDGIVETGNQLMHLLETEKFKELYEAGSEEMQSRQSLDQFRYYLTRIEESFGELSYPQLREVYHLTSSSDKKQLWVPCNLGKEGMNDMHLVPANRTLAVVVYRARTEREAVRVIVRMEKQKDGWKFSAAELYPITINHKLYSHYFKKAQEYREKNHLHLAVLYYKTAIMLSEMGMGVQEFVSQAIVKQIQQIKVDYLPSGKIEAWEVGEDVFKVYTVDTAYEKGHHLVQVRYVAPSLEDEEKLKSQARKLAGFVNRKFPQYRKGFDGIRIMASSEKNAEAMRAWHKTFLFSELPEPENMPETGKESP